MKTLRPKLFCLLIAMAVGCTVAYAQKDKDKEDKEQPQTASEKAIEAKACPAGDVSHSASTDKNSHPTPEAPPDKAMIYVVRPTMMGNKIQTKLAVDQKWMGVNRGDNYFFFTLDPGTHYFCSTAENHSVLSLAVEAGKTYYLQQKITMGFMKARNHLATLSEDEGKKGVAKSHPSSFETK